MQQLHPIIAFTAYCSPPNTAFEGLMLRRMIPIILHGVVAIFYCQYLSERRSGQNSAQKPEEKPANKQAEKPPHR